MREGWELKPLKDVCEKITDGTHQTPKYFDEGVIFLSSRNVTSGKINWDKIKYIDEEQHIAMHKRVAPKVGDILLAKNGTTGVAAMVDRDVIFDIYVSLAHIRVLNEVLPNYMLYFINSPLAKKQFNKRLKGMGVPNLHLKEIREVLIPFPLSLKKQTQIVKTLDIAFKQIDQAKANLEKNLNNAKELFQSKLNEVFSQRGEGWEEKVLKDIVNIKTGKLNSNAMVDGGKYAFFTCSRAVFAIDEYAFDCEAVLLAGNNASGDFNVKYFKGKFNAYQRTYVITTKENNILSYSLLKYKLINHLKNFKKQSVGANTRFLKIGMIQNLTIQLPSYPKQQKIVEKLNKLSIEIENLELSYQQKLNNLEELKKSILQKAFRGEL